MKERSTDILKAIFPNRNDLIAKTVTRGMEKIVSEGHMALENACTMEQVARVQGRIETARAVIRAINEEPVKLRKEKTND